MKRNPRTLIMILAALTGLSAAAAQAGTRHYGNRWRDAVEGSGEITVEARNLDSFDRVKNFGPFDLYISQGSDQDVVIRFDDNLIEFVETKVKGHTLHVSTDESFVSDHTCRIEITLPELESISSHGSGDIYIDRLKAESFDLKVSGSGDITVDELTVADLTYDVNGSGDCELNGITARDCEIEISGSGDAELSGSCDELRIEISGSGDIDARDLEVKDATVAVYGSGDVSVNVSERLDATVYGSGDISYYSDGLDKISTHVSGSGRIRKR